VIPEVGWFDIAVRLLVAAGLTGAIGLERELRDRAAGLRTHMLVGIGAALFTIVSAYGWTAFEFSARSGIVFDPTRIAAQIVTGIGFLGAGAILRQGLTVRGLTTAASLWVVAAIGMAAGAGFYSAAVITTAIVLVGLGPFRWLEGGTTLSRFRRGGRHLEIDLGRDHSIAEPLAVIDGRRVRVSRVQFEDELDRRRLRVELDLPLGPAEERLVEELASLEGVRAVRWSE
jgi:putative Mg2+ transporter-C (MgtC) family protein